MKKILSLLFFVVFVFNFSYSQCVISASANAAGNTSYDTIEICLGQSVNLSSNGTCSFLMDNDFNGSSLGVGWYNTSANPVFNNPCQCPFVAGQPPATCNTGAPVQIGPDSIYAWVGTTASSDRSLTTQPYDLTVFTSTGGCRIKWWMMYGITPNAGSCEDPDAANEGVHLQYSTNGLTWTDFPAPNNNPIGNLSPTPPFNTAVPGTGGYWSPSSALSAQLQSTLYFWNLFESNVPAIAYTSTTRFRFDQLATSSTGYDAWGIDKVSIVCNAANSTTVMWSNGVAQYNQTVTPLVNTKYFVTITDTTSTPYISATDSVYIIVNPVPTPFFNVITPICSDDTTIINYTGSSTTNPIFHWSIAGDTIRTNGSGAGPISVLWNKPINPSTSVNTISLIVENQYHCFSTPALHDVIVNATPDIGFTSVPFLPAYGCSPLSITFSDETTPAVGSWKWDFGDGDTSSIKDPTHIYQTVGVFPLSLAITTVDGCKGKFFQNAAVTVYAQPIANFTWNPPIGTRLDPMINFVNLTTPVDPTFTWHWDFGDGGTDVAKDPSHSYPSIAEEKDYTVTLIAISNFGCKDTVVYTNVKIIDDVLIFPNIITPNGDGINDKFEIGALIKGGGYTEMQVLIYNRWGKKVYENTNYQNDFGGEGLPDGVYYVSIKAKGILKDIEYKSSLQILR